jgi:hypothetical protein
MEQREKERYLEDLKAIRDTLKSQEGGALLEPWAYLTWALITAAATGVSWWLYLAYGLGAGELALKVWLPAVLLGGSLETIGWIRYMKREEAVLRSERMQRMMLSFCGILVALTVLGFSFASSGAGLAGFFVLALSIALMAVGIYSWKSLFIEAYLLMIVGVIMLVFSADSVAAHVASGFICSGGFLVAGLHVSILEKRRHG